MVAGAGEGPGLPDQMGRGPVPADTGWPRDALSWTQRLEFVAVSKWKDEISEAWTHGCLACTSPAPAFH